MQWLDWLIVVAYLTYVIWDGIRLTKGSNSIEGFFLANRSMPWWAVGLSVMATQASAITLVGTTGQGYVDGMRFVQFYYALPIAMIILCVTVVPFFHRAKVYTAYEYLENRFDAKTRTLTSFFFLLSRGLGVGVIIAAPAVILSVVLGWSELITIFAIGLTTTFYTMFGGIKAVTWTDVKQMILIFIGLGIAFFIILGNFPEGVSFTDGLHLAGANGKLTTLETKFDLTEKYTIWSGLIAALFLFLSYFGCDQSQVQRYLTAKSVDDGRTSLLMSAFLKIPMQAFILLIGVMVFVFYQFQAPPMIFNPAEEAKISQNATYQSLEKEYATLHSERRKSALLFLKEGSEYKNEYLEANKKLRETRTKAIVNKLTRKWQLTAAALLIVFLVAGLGWNNYIVDKRIGEISQRLLLLSNLRKGALEQYFDTVEAELRFWATNKRILSSQKSLINDWRLFRLLQGDPQASLQELYVHGNPYPAGELQRSWPSLKKN